MRHGNISLKSSAVSTGVALLNASIELSAGKPAPNEWVIQKLFGRRHWCAPWVAELCRADPAFILHLAQQASGYIHVICLVRLRTQRRSHPWSQYPLSELGACLRSSTRKGILEQLHPRNGAALATILPKLGATPLTVAAYEALLALVRNPVLLEHLRRAPAISAYALQFLAEIDTTVPPLPVWFKIHSAASLNRARFLYSVMRTLQGRLLDPRLPEYLSSAKSLGQLTTWLRRAVAKLEFPPPPWLGTDWLYPLRSGMELHAAAQRFGNCAFRYLEETLAGSHHIYVSEPGPIMFRLERDALFGWRITEKEGIGGPGKRRILCQDTHRKCLEAFASAGIYTCQEMEEHRASFLDTFRSDWDL